MSDLVKLERILGIRFRDEAVYKEALTHKSFAAEHQLNYDNQRLELLGDAVVQIILTDYLYRRYTGLQEGDLTKIRSAMVNQDALAHFARDISLGSFLLLGHGEEMSGGRDRQTNLEDVFEAVIGAIYLDQGWEVAKDYVTRQLMPLFKQVEQGGILKDYKTILQEVVYQEAQQTVSYELVSTSGPDHDKTFTFHVKITGKVMGTGTGRSKKEAEQKAAKEALAKIAPTR
jgi:ribonuclease-3